MALPLPKHLKMSYPVLRLIHGKEEALARRHPWIFSGALAGGYKGLDVGSAVWIADSNGTILATGLFEGGSIAIKVLAFETTELNTHFFVERFRQAWELRRRLGLVGSKTTNAFRLVHSEGDELPGLVVDVYGKTAVMQCHSPGIYRMRQLIAEALLESSMGWIENIYDKSNALQVNGLKKSDGYLVGEHQNTMVIENGHQFIVDWVEGQKTGFFLDQREARMHLGQFSKGCNVLNAFSYTGGFSVYALAAGAKHVVSVDSSRRAIEWCEKNVELNGNTNRHTAVCADVKKYLEEVQPGQFEIIVLDPPAFAKHHSQRHKGLLGYKFINASAIKKIASGGLLYTFSCSQAVDRQAFQSVVMAAAIEIGRRVQVLHHFSQPADHPVSLFHPEGAYLKGLLIRVL
jgi:23S rRNA (cytosine1962-C5)-methyltransferase